jgi:hypothetical protein
MNKILFIILFIILCIIFLASKIIITEKFAGNKQSSEKLNNTLKQIANDLNESNINNWFVGYGTLLGIVRNNSCIEGDDDIDIIIDKNESNKLHDLIKKKNYNYDNHNKTNFTRILLSDDLAPVDFYIATKEKNNFNETWEKVIWTNVFPLTKKKWEKNCILNIPNNYETKLEGRYGKTWKEPKNWKGPKPAKKVI